MTEQAAMLEQPDIQERLGITEISVSGFKSIRDEQRIEIRPLTLLAGANSSGKSSIMQPLLLLKQTLEAPYDPGTLLLNGPNIKFTSADQLLSMYEDNSLTNIFSVGLCSTGIPFIRMYYERIGQKGFNIKKLEVSENDRAVFWPDMSQEDMATSLSHIRHVIPSHITTDEAENLNIFLIQTRCFLEPSYVLRSARPGGVRISLEMLGTSILRGDLLGLLHIPGLRANPEREYNVASAGDYFPGTFDNYVASVIAQRQEDHNTDKLQALSDDLFRLGLASSVVARRLDDARVQIQVSRVNDISRNTLNNLVDISDVGLGVSQTLPIIVALHVARPGQLVYIEQPELHLHPRAQSAMARVLADAALRGVRVVAETHSDLLLLGVQTLVAEGHLPPDLVKLHWFQRGEDGATQISSADIDETGAYGDWPEDFGQVIFDAQGRYLDAADRRLRQQGNGHA